ncbi:hypothetical protein EIP91_012423 [Steccherinum ochraceum]|uniref:Uncharacterized protein n=1 Tax=Steccherinum ochraceum TaxID=92696 RepID=A0A4R0RUG9_9APHY|nr:hypothetical protein EIP91_012423 [Steccherinum ochraceum]
MPRSSEGDVNPAAVHQSKFRVVPKKSYSERMSETRAEIRRMMKDALREITQDENASMRWPSYWKDIVVKYRVVIVGWPHDEVPFRNLSDVSNLQKLELLFKGWQEHSIYFRRLTDAEFATMSEERAMQG